MPETTITYVIESNQSLVGWDTLITTLIAIFVSLLAVYVAYRLQRWNEERKDKKRREKLLESIRDEVYYLLRRAASIIRSIEGGIYLHEPICAPVLSACITNVPDYIMDDIKNMSLLYQYYAVMREQLNIYINLVNIEAGEEDISKISYHKGGRPARLLKHYIKQFMATSKKQFKELKMPITIEDMKVYLSTVDCIILVPGLVDIIEQEWHF